MNELWNPNGTNTWAMIDCFVTSVALTGLDGRTKMLTTAKDDDIIGLPIINNPESAFPKLVDVDPDQQQSPTIYLKAGTDGYTHTHTVIFTAISGA